VHRFIKAVGGGATRSRDLTRDEAREAMGLIADGAAEPVQVGAFLMALRMKGESADELAGFAEALGARALVATAPPGTLDVDCHGDGHAGRPTLLPAAACAVAALGVPVVLRADLGSPTARHGLGPALTALGLDSARPLDPARAAAALTDGGLGVIDLGTSCPPLKRLVDLRPLFGRRTVAQTLMKLLDPLRAAARLVGVFHAPYLESTARALTQIAASPALCVQALGGLPEATAGKLLRACSGGEPFTLDLRALDAVPFAATQQNVDDAAVQQNRAALAAEEPALGRAAAAAALLLYAARGQALVEGAAEARRALGDGRARAVAARLGGSTFAPHPC
jgi:anthranilate phosphoribosyltransferase